MKTLHIVPHDVDLSFISKRLIYFAVSGFLILASIGLVLTKGLNFGIDFKGGILVEVRTDGPADIGAMRDQLSTLGLGEISLQEFGLPTDVLISHSTPRG